MGAVSGPKGIVDVHVRQGSHLLGQFEVILFLFGVEAGIFEHQHLAGFERFGGSFGYRANAVFGKGHRLAHQLRQVICHRFEGVFGIRTTLGPAQVRAQDHSRAVIEQILDGRQGRPNAGIVAHFAILDRYVEIDPHQDLFTFYIDIANGFLLNIASSHS